MPLIILGGSMQIINWFQDASWEQKIVLGGTAFFISAAWNIRDESWNISIYDSSENPIIVGRKLTLNVDILRLVHAENKPQGRLFAIAIANDVDEITRDNMGSEIELVFVGYDEVL